MKIQHILFTGLMIFLASCSAFADPGNARILLTGTNLNMASPQELTVKNLESMFSLVTLDLYNPWEKKTDKYTGFWMTEFVTKLAKPGLRTLNFKAIDNYQVDFTEKDWTKFKILIATRVNNQYQPVRHKGPMRLIYADYDSSNIEHELTLTKWMWMIKKVEFK
ncbi:hypothetical protein VA7868_04398 [Vibrio aerogenes CECT 7868]|uniref:Oxidoreductase molybdopterin binding domain protein n=1 Tax=Vibrio aerogenes CECT 7868 TaxID=1216006 RepID=A0A1M6E7U8_9VIBR|nr:hypothetical protein [Vibrio aerogenes]SHI81515.1 hypothetical protein VA7868_04398 [Vibrio aerogenes CECT 7868]